MNTFNMPPYRITDGTEEIAILVERQKADGSLRDYIMYYGPRTDQFVPDAYRHDYFPTWWQPVQIGV